MESMLGLVRSRSEAYARYGLTLDSKSLDLVERSFGAWVRCGFEVCIRPT